MRKLWFRTLYVSYQVLDWLRGKLLKEMVRAVRHDIKEPALPRKRWIIQYKNPK